MVPSTDLYLAMAMIGKVRQNWGDIRIAPNAPESLSHQFFISLDDIRQFPVDKRQIRFSQDFHRDARI